MKMIYANFDGLDVSFQCRVPSAILDVLEAAKLEAQARKKEAGARLGELGIPVLVSESGARGGYAYRFDTGPDGETWFVGKSDKAVHWSVRVSVHSLSLALYGYTGVKARLLDMLAAIGAEGPALVDPVTKEVSNRPVESIGRFDFCADIASDAEFQPDETRFLAHSRSGRMMIDQADDLPRRRERRGRRLESITIGRMPGRQATVYDKTCEIVAHGKSYWWDLWGLDKDDFKGAVWRVEVRAGKDELRKWNLRSFADFERMAGDVTYDILRAIRYVIPSTSDTNPTRWPNDPLWALAVGAAEQALAAYVCNAERKKIIADLQAKIRNTFRNLFLGLLPGYTYAMGLDVSEVPAAIEAIAADMMDSASQAPDALVRKYNRAAERYVFLDGPPAYGPVPT